MSEITDVCNIIRGLNRSGVLVISTHGVLGKGTEKQICTRRVPDKQAINMCGTSFASRLVFGVIAKKYYDKKKSAVFDSYLEYYTSDAARLIAGSEGFLDSNGRKWTLAFIGSLGDWPWHAKSGHLKASFMNVQRVANSSSRPKPICHLCMAGAPGMPWESMSLFADFLGTLEDREECWTVDGKLLTLIQYHGNRALAYRCDGWHCFHLGCGRGFVASGLVDALCRLLYPEAGSVETKLEHLQVDLDAYLAAKHKKLESFSYLTRERLGWKSTSKWPEGTWSKAGDTVTLLQFLIHLLHLHRDVLDEKMQLVLEAAEAIDFFWKGVYSHGLWITAKHAIPLANAGFVFLQTHSRLAKLSLDLHECRYMQMPKLHLLFHIFYSMLSQARSCGFCFNPIADTVQQDEDLVGQLSRMTRRVAQRKMSLRSLEAYLVRLQEDWQKPFVFGEL